MTTTLSIAQLVCLIALNNENRSVKEGIPKEGIPTLKTVGTLFSD